MASSVISYWKVNLKSSELQIKVMCAVTVNQLVSSCSSLKELITFFFLFVFQLALINCALKAVYLAAFKEICLFLAFIPNPRWLGLMNSSNRMGTSVRRNFQSKSTRKTGKSDM